MNRCNVFIGLLLLTCNNSWGQQFSEKQFRKFSVRDGLSNNYITSVQQDEDGFIWIATDAGLNRFDGNSFTSYLSGNQKIPLRSVKINRLIYLHGNRLGIISRNGFQILQTKTFAVNNFIVPDTTMFSNYLNSIWDAQLLNEQTVAVSGSAGFYTFSENGTISFRHDAYDINDVGKKSIFYGRQIFRINDTEALVYLQGNRLGYYNHQQKKFREVQPDDTVWGIFRQPPGSSAETWIANTQLNTTDYLFIHLENSSIYYYQQHLKKLTSSKLPFSAEKELNYESRITIFNDSTLLLNGGKAGFYVLNFNKKTGSITCNIEKQLPAVKVNSIYVSSDKRLWIGTPQGLLMQKLTPDFFTDYSYNSEEVQDHETGFFTDVITHKNKLYATRYSGTTGLAIVDKETMRIEQTISFFHQHQKWNEALSVQMYHNDTLWIGTNAGILWFSTKTNTYDSIPHLQHCDYPNANNIRLYSKTSDSVAWFCYSLCGKIGKYNSRNKTFTFYTSGSEPPLPFTKIKHIVQDADGYTWIAGHSLSRLNHHTGQFDHTLSVYAGEKKFNDNILLIASDHRGSLWIHNEENGLLEYNTRLHRFTAYGTEHGLPDINFHSMSLVIDSVLWMANDKTVTAFNTINKQLKWFGFPSAIAGSKPSGRTIYHDTAIKKMYLPVGNHLLVFPSAIQTPNTGKPGITIEDLVVNEKKIYYYPSNAIQLSHLENNIELHYTLVDFDENENYLFFYKLKEDANWIPVGKQRSILLTDLPHGTYHLQVKAAKDNYSTVAAINIRVTPPFWKATWFFILLTITGSSFLLLLFGYRIKKVREKAELDRKLMATEMKALQSQMNPHFIFNSLNSIKSMILSENNADASRYLSKFAHLMRLTLSQSDQPFISLKNNIEYLQRYIEMERIRNENFTSAFEVDQRIDTETMYLPPMLLQPLVENAIWHAVDKEHEPLQIDIRFKLDNDLLVCIIEDNGIGIDQSINQKENAGSSHQSVGIRNIRNRISLLNEKYNLACSLTIVDKSKQQPRSTGTKAILKLSIKPHVYETHQNHTGR